MQDYLVEARDMYGLSSRIKKICRGYRLFFNMKTKKYEVHDISNKVCSLCLVVEPQMLDCRVISRLMTTRRENMKKLFLEMEESNRKLELEHERKLQTDASDMLYEIFDYAVASKNDLSRECIASIIKTNKGENYA